MEYSSQVVLEKHPGLLYQQALKEVKKFLGARGGALGSTTSQQWVSYLTVVVAGRQKVPAEKMQELRTLAESLNHLGTGNRLADLLVQRFKSIELEAGGHKDIAENVELVDLNQVGLTSRNEMLSARRLQLTKRKLTEAPMRSS